MNEFQIAWRRYWTYGEMIQRLIIVNVIVFAFISLIRIIAFFVPSESTSIIQNLVTYLAMPSTAQGFILQPWGIITSIFLHKEFGHILWNMLSLYIFGSIFEDLFGKSKVLGLYLLGGIAGCLAYMFSYHLFPAINLYLGNYVLGASAAVSAIMIATAMKSPNYEIKLLFIGFVKIKYLVFIAIFLDFVAISNTENAGGHIAHLGGYLMGALFIFGLSRGYDLTAFFTVVFDFFKGLNKPKPAFKHTRPSKKPAYSSASSRNANEKATERPVFDFQERLDAILDKIKQNGYDSLTEEEKVFLFKASNR